MNTHEIIEIILNGLAADLGCCPTATFKEGRAVTTAGAALLVAGLTLVECYPSTGDGMKIRMVKGWIVGEHCALQMRAPSEGCKQDKPDLRLLEPALHVEFKSLPAFGAKALVSVKALNADIEKLLRGAADIFVLCADDKMYDQARGAKRDPRGRPRLEAAILDRILPAVHNLPVGITDPCKCTGPISGTMLKVWQTVWHEQIQSKDGPEAA